MKLFDPYAALAEIENQAPTPATSATFATQAPKTAQNVAIVANVATGEAEISKSGAASQPNDMRHGFAINGHPKTWTGNIVSLAHWRLLTEWEKHGPGQKRWSGKTRRWEDQ